MVAVAFVVVAVFHLWEWARAKAEEVVVGAVVVVQREFVRRMYGERVKVMA